MRLVVYVYACEARHLVTNNVHTKNGRDVGSLDGELSQQREIVRDQILNEKSFDELERFQQREGVTLYLPDMAL